MTFSQAAIFIFILISLLIIFDWLFSKLKKDWKPLPWEEDDVDFKND